MTFEENDISLILKALTFSAEKHKNQRRKGAEGSPYINHPINVAQILWKVVECARLPSSQLRSFVTLLRTLKRRLLNSKSTLALWSES